MTKWQHFRAPLLPTAPRLIQIDTGKMLLVGLISEIQRKYLRVARFLTVYAYSTPKVTDIENLN